MQIQMTDAFERRLQRLRDAAAKQRILQAVYRMREGNFGDSRPIGEGVIETRLHHGPGYRIYFARRGAALVLLLICGDKSSQAGDIAFAKELAKLA